MGSVISKNNKSGNLADVIREKEPDISKEGCEIIKFKTKTFFRIFCSRRSCFYETCNIGVLGNNLLEPVNLNSGYNFWFLHDGCPAYHF